MGFRILGWSLAAAGLVLMSACGGDRDLDALFEEPIATVELPDAIEADRRESQAENTLGKPSPAIIRRSFVPNAGNDLQRLLADALDEARRLGWNPEPGNVQSQFIDTKQVGNATIELIVVLANGVDGETVVIRLEYRG